LSKLDGKVVLVCGGATGIGAATVRRLCEEGARVGVGDRNIDGAQVLVDDLVGTGADAAAWAYDQAEEASIKALVVSAVTYFGQLDGLFANAADMQVLLQDGDILSNDIQIWERTLSVNVTGTAMVLRAALPHLLDQGGGSVVLTSSSASTAGEAERPAYAASKAGINALCRHVASRWGREGIRCNAIAPGLVITEQLEQNMPPEFLEKLLKSSRSIRHGEPMDIAATVAFLMSEDGAWVNGQTWHVNGGATYSN
jgi:NAD(P)-dependent dehydrogenase (short-subunit alcohol dehydrogenase family)